MHELNGPVEVVASRLLGAHFVRQLGDRQIIARIIEVEAYDQSDPASHSFRGQTERNKTMFGPAGHLYVYFTYGMHFCCNIVVGPIGQGAAVLIRAAEVLEGLDVVRQNRPGISDRQLTNGPGKLCQALQINRDADGHDLTQLPIQLHLQKPIPATNIKATPRIGISKAIDRPWRFNII